MSFSGSNNIKKQKFTSEIFNLYPIKNPPAPLSFNKNNFCIGCGAILNNTYKCNYCGTIYSEEYIKEDYKLIEPIKDIQWFIYTIQKKFFNKKIIYHQDNNVTKVINVFVNDILLNNYEYFENTGVYYSYVKINKKLYIGDEVKIQYENKRMRWSYE